MASSGDDGLRQRKTAGLPKVVTSEEAIETTPTLAGWVMFLVVLGGIIMWGIVVFAAVIYIREDVIHAKQITLGDPPPFEGPLAPNNELTKVTKYFQGVVKGPESLVASEGYIYTGTADGIIYRMIPKSGVVEKVAMLGNPPCGFGPESEHTCGRPLGMRIDSNGYLIVLDAYLGLFKVNPATGDAMQFFSSNYAMGGKKPKLLNDLDIDRDGMIYLTDTSTRWQRRDFLYCLLEGDDTGRLIRYDSVMNTSEVLMTGLSFANGVQLSRDKSFLLVAETTKFRILKYHLRGEKAGQSEVFADNLPGPPDNIRLCSSGGYWVSLATCRSGLLLNFMVTAKPALKNAVAKIFSKSMMMSFVKPCGLVVQLGNNGEILSSLQDLSGTVMSAISEVHDDGGLLTFGSYHQPYVAQLDTRHKPWKH